AAIGDLDLDCGASFVEHELTVLNDAAARSALERDRRTPHAAAGRDRWEEAAVQRERAISGALHDRMVHGHELGAVRKRAFDLHFVDHRVDTVHHIPSPEQTTTQVHH